MARNRMGKRMGNREWGMEQQADNSKKREDERSEIGDWREGRWELGVENCYNQMLKILRLYNA